MPEQNEGKKEKCFVIMPISDQGDYPQGHFTKVYEQIIKPSVEEAGYEAYRVDENNICDAILNKIFSAIQECPMAICDLSNRNPNVLYELGLRQAYDKPVVLIQDDQTDKIFDVSGISTVFYKSTRLYEDVIKARENIRNAILATKNGKANTLAKIMKVSAADFSQVEVSQDDKMNVVLNGIYNEIKKLTDKEQRNESNNKQIFENIYNSDVFRNVYLKLEGYNSEILETLKKRFLLNKQEIEDIIFTFIEDNILRVNILNINEADTINRFSSYLGIIYELKIKIIDKQYY